MAGTAERTRREMHNMANNDNGAGILVAFIAGAAVGAAVALLFAPATGEETREYLGQRAREGRDRAADAARQGRELLNKQRDNVTTAFDRARQQFQGTPGEEQDA
jgi:gas vesicle protein